MSVPTFDLAPLFSLSGKVALVTGGSRNLGRWMAEALLAQGAKVYISSRNADSCAATARELGPDCIALPQDVSTVEGCRALAAAYRAHEDRLDILVNNAGAAWGASFENFPESGWDKVLNLNLKSPFFLTQALYESLCAAGAHGGPAKVVNIASVDGERIGAWDTYSYQSSKAALIFLTRKLAQRLIRDRIIVNAISPGSFPSDMNKVAREHEERVSKVIPAGRVGTREDIGAALCYLVSRAGDYVIGETLTVDGGIVNATAGPSLDGL